MVLPKEDERHGADAEACHEAHREVVVVAGVVVGQCLVQEADAAGSPPEAAGGSAVVVRRCGEKSMVVEIVFAAV